MSKRIDLNPGEEIMYRTRTSAFIRFMVHYFAGCMTAPFFGLGLMLVFGWGLSFYSDVVITNQRVILKKSGFLRGLGGHRSIPLERIYLSGGWRFVGGDASLESAMQRSVQHVELDLLDGKTVNISIPRANVFLARLADAIEAKNAAA